MFTFLSLSQNTFWLISNLTEKQTPTLPTYQKKKSLPKAWQHRAYTAHDDWSPCLNLYVGPQMQKDSNKHALYVYQGYGIKKKALLRYLNKETTKLKEVPTLLQQGNFPTIKSSAPLRPRTSRGPRPLAKSCCLIIIIASALRLSSCWALSRSSCWRLLIKQFQQLSLGHVYHNPTSKTCDSKPRLWNPGSCCC